MKNQLVVQFWKHTSPDNMQKVGEWVAFASERYEDLKTAKINEETALLIASSMGAVTWTSVNRCLP